MTTTMPGGERMMRKRGVAGGVQRARARGARRVGGGGGAGGTERAGEAAREEAVCIRVKSARAVEGCVCITLACVHYTRMCAVHSHVCSTLAGTQHSSQRKGQRAREPGSGRGVEDGGDVSRGE
eukprot:3410018-Rhodomonas_salina.1